MRLIHASRSVGIDGLQAGAEARIMNLITSSMVKLANTRRSRDPISGNPYFWLTCRVFKSHRTIGKDIHCLFPNINLESFLINIVKKNAKMIVRSIDSRQELYYTFMRLCWCARMELAAEASDAFERELHRPHNDVEFQIIRDYRDRLFAMRDFNGEYENFRLSVHGGRIG